MTVRIPPHQDWHDDIPWTGDAAVCPGCNGLCECADAWSERGFVDDQCEWHRIEDVIQTLKDHQWEIIPVSPWVTRVPSAVEQLQAERRDDISLLDNDLDPAPPVSWTSEK